MSSEQDDMTLERTRDFVNNNANGTQAYGNSGILGGQDSAFTTATE